MAAHVHASSTRRRRRLGLLIPGPTCMAGAAAASIYRMRDMYIYTMQYGRYQERMSPAKRGEGPTCTVRFWYNRITIFGRLCLQLPTPLSGCYSHNKSF